MSTSAQAGLIGDTVTVSGSGWSFPNSTAVVVDPGVEFTGAFGSDSIYSIDVLSDSIILTWNHIAQHFHGFSGFGARLSDLDWVGMNGSIIDVAVQPGNSLLTQVSFGDDWIQWSHNDGFTPGEIATATLNITATHVPEPATIALMGLGLAGIGYRRSQKA
jgi:hypothetical protein